MRSVFAYPGNMADAQHAAAALVQAGVLDAYVTSFVWRRGGRAARWIERLPRGIADRVSRQLERRAIDAVDPAFIDSSAHWEIARTLAQRLCSPVLSDLAWDCGAHSFDRFVARRWVPRTRAVHAYEYTALASFERARQEGVARILHLPSLDSLAFADIEREEKRAWPELSSTHDSYFERKLATRYARRKAEIALADLIVTNSTLTARSHIAAGAPAEKVVAIPLAAPPTIARLTREPDRNAPLQVLWAGRFTPGKGAHYALMAWRALRAGRSARLDIYGEIAAPARLLSNVPEGVSFNGSVPRQQLFTAYEHADVLLFPTLSDGFGLVAAEAMAHGLPVITTHRAGASDLVTADNGFVVPAADAIALTEALRWCLDNRDRLAQMRHHALATARARQWSDYRRELIGALDIGLRRAGYMPSYGNMTEGAAWLAAAS